MAVIFRVLYCSRNTLVGSPAKIDAEIAQILETSRRNNARVGVTGGLLYSDGCFAQVLEGPMDCVETVFERIQCDPRHSDVTVLQATPVDRRDFPDWSMAFAGGTKRHEGLPAALEACSSMGEEIMETLRRVVGREAEWLAAAE